ncbi:MAG: redoxin domain-containing protein, partial [Verrucomicrobiota bacterium]
SLEKIVEAYPDNIEAKAFLLKQIYYNHGKKLEIPSHFVVNLLAEQILTEAPFHPANHYQIHLWDREDPEKALLAAARGGPSAPAIAHMWHMPGHIYSRLHRYEDAVWQQEASARIDHAHMMTFRIVPDRISNFAHNNEWCVRNLNYLGQLDRSVELSKNMISLPRLAKFKKEDGEEVWDGKGGSWQYGRDRYRDTLVRFEQWDDLIEESTTGLLQADEQYLLARDVDRFLGIAHFEQGDLEEARASLARIESALEIEEEKQAAAVVDARTKAKKDGKSEDEVKKAADSAKKEFEKTVDPLARIRNELQVYDALADSPARTEEALERLSKLKNLAKWRHAKLWLRAGNKEKAIELAAAAVKDGENEVLPLATQVEILDAAGKTKERDEAFESLRIVASVADLEIPPLARLAPIADELGYPEDWRTASKPSADLGERPPLNSLGPFRWSPPAAPAIEVLAAAGDAVSLENYPGRSILFLFFLGRECSHCMEQLNAFEPFVEAYREAGIELVAVSADSVAELPRTIRDDENASPFSFPLLSDESLESFRAFRAYDDFEGLALHGTFLLDPDRRIRWQEIGHEPFLHPEWLLKESTRLLKFPAHES